MIILILVVLNVFCRLVWIYLDVISFGLCNFLLLIKLFVKKYVLIKLYGF